MKKIIYTQRVEIVESYNERRDCADVEIAKLIWECGFLPVPVNNIRQNTAGMRLNAMRPKKR